MSSRSNDDEAHLVLNRRRSARTASAVVYSTVDGYGQYDSHPVQETFTEELKPTDLVETERDFRSRQQRNTRARARAISRADHRAHLLHAKVAHSPSTTRAAARQSAATIMHADNTPPRLNNQAQAPLRDAMEGDVGFMVLNHSRDLLSTPLMQSLAMHVDGTPSTGHLLHAEAYSPPTRAAAWQSSAAMSMHADNTPPRLRQAHAPMGGAVEGDVGWFHGVKPFP